MRRAFGATVAIAAALLVLPQAAVADHHEVRISEVFPGTSANPTSDFVELRMYSPGQNSFAPNASLILYSAASGGTTLPLTDVASGASQRTLLAGTAQTETIFSLQVDVESANVNLTNDGGGVCLTSATFGTIDCVAWGPVTLPSAGPSAPAITDGFSLQRELLRGCNTLLEPGDDTDSSLADFSDGFPVPRPNNGTLETSSCPDTVFTLTPERQTTDRTPIFRMRASPTSSFECKRDSAPTFKPCSSPYRPAGGDPLPLGKHKLLVRATESDGSIEVKPARHTWTIIPPR